MQERRDGDEQRREDKPRHALVRESQQVNDLETTEANKGARRKQNWSSSNCQQPNAAWPLDFRPQWRPQIVVGTLCPGLARNLMRCHQ